MHWVQAPEAAYNDGKVHSGWLVPRVDLFIRLAVLRRRWRSRAELQKSCVDCNLFQPINRLLSNTAVRLVCYWRNELGLVLFVLFLKWFSPI